MNEAKEVVEVLKGKASVQQKLCAEKEKEAQASLELIPDALNVCSLK